jgi:Cof subfamily protein (haloacid dehalogenase superfamily)
MIKAIFFDIDGTLVSFQTHRMSERVKEALWTLRRKGVKLLVATGRPMVNINNLEGFLFDGFITMNGALTYLDGKIVDGHPLTREDARKVAALATELDTTAWVFTEDFSGVNQMTAKATAFAERIHIFPSGFVDLERMAETTDIYEYTFFISIEDEHRLLRPILSHADYPRWHPDFTDIVAKGLSKASAASILLDRLGIAREECMAFGDGGNDVPLIEYAGIGVAMGNAAEEVKAVADLVTRSVDEDGIVATLKNFGLL